MQLIQLTNQSISLRTLLIPLIRNSLIRLSNRVDEHSEPLGETSNGGKDECGEMRSDEMV